MNILLSLSPSIAFFVLMRVVHPLAGLVGAFTVSLLSGVFQWRRGESVKVLEIGSLALFGALVFYTLVAAPEWTVCSSGGPSRCNMRARACQRNSGRRRFF